MQFCSDLYALEVTSDECLSKVRFLLSCPSEVSAVRDLQGSQAETFIEFLDRALPQLPLDDKFRQRGLRLLSKICKAQEIIPASYILQQESIRIGSFRDRGGYSEVSDGEYLGYAVAIKDLKIKRDDFDRIFKRFCREVIGWKHLSHPNVLPLLGVSVSKERHCFRILSEWMPNGTLTQYTRSHPEANRLRLLSELSSGVAYLHELCIVHGDLKAANVLVDSTGAARIGDFGFMTMGDIGTIFFSNSIDSSGGTLEWMSPELLESFGPGCNTRPTRESDCYALGMAIYEVLTGRRPFHGQFTYQVMRAVVEGRHPVKPPYAKSLGFSDELWALVESCWSRSSSERPTAERLLDHLSRTSPDWAPPPSTSYPIAESDGDSDTSSSSPVNSKWGEAPGDRTADPDPPL